MRLLSIRWEQEQEKSLRFWMEAVLSSHGSARFPTRFPKGGTETDGRRAKPLATATARCTHLGSYFPHQSERVQAIQRCCSEVEALK